MLLALAIVATLIPLSGCPQTDAGKSTVFPPRRTEESRRQDRIQSYMRIAALLPLTGTARESGLTMQRGIDLALQAANTAGDVQGRKLLVVYADTRGDAEAARSEAEKLIADVPPDSLIYGAFGEEAEAVAEMAETQAVPLLIAASTGEAGASAGDDSARPCVFSLCATPELEGRALAFCAADELAAKRVSIVWDESSDSSRYAKTAMLDEFATHHPGIKVSDVSESGDAAHSYGALTERLKEQTPDAVILLVDGSAAVAMLRAIRDAGIEANLLGWHRLSGASFLRSASGAVEGMMLVTHFAPDEPVEAVGSFVSAYAEAYGQAPDEFAALAYDAVGLVAEAMKRARSFDPEALAVALAQTKEYPGVTGAVSIDASHNADRRVVLARVELGKLHFVRAIKVSELSATPSLERAESEQE